MADKKTELKKCGIIMPISEWDGCDETHWRDVKALIERAASTAGFKGILVSQADDVGVIQKRIVQNLYDSPVVVCDISGRNANVMFELGMRLAFDKPTIIIKDDVTPFSFDTSPVEHVTYPRDLRYNKIEDFQRVLSEKIEKSAESSGDDSFLKSFGSFKVADIPVERASIDEIILDEISSLKSQIMNMQKASEFGSTSLVGSYFGAKQKTSGRGIASQYETVVYKIAENLNAVKTKSVFKAASRIEELKGVKQVHFHLHSEGSGPEITIELDRLLPADILHDTKGKIDQMLMPYM